MKICKDGRVWGQNNKEAGTHLGILTGRRRTYIKRGASKTHSESITGDKNPMYGRTHSIEARRKIGARREEHWNWKGGIADKNVLIRQSIETKLWKEAVCARDNWTCQKCGKKGVRMQAHHIKTFSKHPELRFVIDNGIALCYECHKLTDNYAGKGAIRTDV